jgi:SLT domain-containing protein
MNAVIGAALGDINGLAAATTTPAGQQALVHALAGRLEQTWQALTNGHADASTRAASSAQLAAAYSGISSYPGGRPAPTWPMATMAAMGAVSPMQNMSMLAAPSIAANQAALSGAAQLSSAQQQSASNSNGQSATLTSAITPTGPKPVPISLTDVLHNINNKIQVSTGQAAFTNYANQALDRMGITDKTARANWMTGLVTAAQRESSWNPLAVNNWDSNATGPIVSDGSHQNSSRGLMQTIPSTFAAYHQYNTKYNIYDPVANITAAMNYLIKRYHVELSGKNLHDVPQFDPYSAGGGY